MDRGTTQADRLKRWASVPRPMIAPSLLACDFSRMAEELRAVEAAGAQALHLDVMDGVFVPNLSYGPPVIRRWREITDLPFDAHLMMVEPERHLDAFLAAGCDQVIVHIETCPDPRPILDRIRAAGCRAALSLNPPTLIDAITPYLDQLDAVLVMSVMPGFGGQDFQPEALDRVRMLRGARPDLEIAIDGGINPETAPLAAAAGASYLVAGSAIFRAEGSYAEALNDLAEAARRGLTDGGSAGSDGNPGLSGS